jgi:hypothetical protein
VKRLLVAFLAVFLFVGIAYALVGYNSSYSITSLKVRPKNAEVHDTEVTIETVEAAREGETVGFSGRLVDKQTGKGLAGKKVVVGWFGRFDLDKVEVITDSDGYFEGEKRVIEDGQTTTREDQLIASYGGE